MYSRPSGSVKPSVGSALHLKNAIRPINFRVEGRLTEDSRLHSPKQVDGRDVTPSGILIVVSVVQIQKAPEKIWGRFRPVRRHF